MKNQWVGSEETLWNMAQCRASLQCELKSQNSHDSVSCHEWTPEGCRWGGESVTAWALCDIWLETYTSKKSLFIPVLLFWCFKMKTSCSLTTLKRNCWTKPNTTIRGYQLLKIGKNKSYTFVQRLGITDREIGGCSLFYCWCKKFWRKTDEKLVSAKQEKRGQTTGGYLEYFAGISLIFPG